MLPAIADYSPPVGTRLPDNHATWAIDPDRAVLLVHDMQTYFIDAYGADSTLVDGILGRIVALRTAAEHAGVPVYYTAQPPRQDPAKRGLLTEFWGEGLQDDDRARIVDALQPVPDDSIITKWRYDAFVRTDLGDRMAASGRDQLIITGVYAHIGCLMTAASAFMRDIQPFLIADAVADFSEAQHRFALRYAAERCAVVLDTGTATAQLLRDPARQDSGRDGGNAA